MNVTITMEVYEAPVVEVIKVDKVFQMPAFHGTGL